MNEGSNTRKKKGKDYWRKIETKREIENQKQYPKLFGKDSYKRKSEEMIVALYGNDLQEREKERAKIRPLFVLWKNSFYIHPYDWEWVFDMRNKMINLLKKNRLIVFGGSFKDVILTGDNAFTFSIFPKWGDATVARVTLERIIKTVKKLPLFYRERLNVPLSLDDIFYNPGWFLLNIQRKIYVMITKTPLCSNGTLDRYGQRLVKNDSVRLQRFGQLVYELTKVTRELFKRKMFHSDIKPANIFVCQGKNGVKFSLGDIDGLQICNAHLGYNKYVNCDELSPPYTIFYLPYHGALKKGADAFMNRDTYALMKTFLKVFFDMFYPKGNNHNVKSIMRNRVCDDESKCKMPDEPHSEDDVRKTYIDVKSAVKQIGILESYNNIDKEEALKSLKEMMDEVVALISAIDRGFYENYIHEPNILQKKLRSIQTLSKKIGAKPSSNPYQIPTVMLKL